MSQSEERAIACTMRSYSCNRGVSTWLLPILQDNTKTFNASAISIPLHAWSGTHKILDWPGGTQDPVDGCDVSRPIENLVVTLMEETMPD